MRNNTKQKTFDSLTDLRAEFGLNPIRYQTKNKKKLESQREHFSSKHVCPACGENMSYVQGTNVMVCTNKSCQGVEHKVVDEESGEEKVWHSLSFHSLDDTGAKIASNIFAN